ncbi:hypothetical protein ACNKHM_08085 [Shigella sonnei]
MSTAEDAQKYLAIADELFGADWADARHYRFGASSLLASLLKALGHGDGRAPAATRLICRMMQRSSGLAIPPRLFPTGGYLVSRTRNYW